MGERQTSTAGPSDQPDSLVLGSVPLRPLYSSTLILTVAAFGISVAIAVAAATAAALMAGRTEAVAASRNTTASLTRALTDAVARSVNSIDVTLASVAELVGDSGALNNTAELAQAVGHRLRLAPFLRQVLVVRRDGSVVFDSAVPAAGRSIDVAHIISDLERLPRSVHVGGQVPGRYIGGEGKAAGLAYIPMSRALRARDGAISGLVLVAVNPDHFNAMFNEIEVETGTRIQMWRFDGHLLAGAGVTGRATDDARLLPLFRTHLPRAERGSFIDEDDDGVTRITSYRTTLAWPLVLVVGLPMDAALANWRANAQQVGMPVAVVTLAVLALTALLVRTLMNRGRDEAALRLSDRVLANVSNGVTIADARQPDLPLIYVNRAFEQITGYGAAETLGKNARFLHRGREDQAALDEVREALTQGKPVRVKLRNVRADGAEFWNQLSLTPVRGSSGEIRHWVGVQNDITEEERSRVALAEAYEQVARYGAEQERFAFVLAHHLQEPARQIRVQAQLMVMRFNELAEGEDTGPADLIMEASSRLVKLLRDVQAYLAVERQFAPDAHGSARLAFDAAVAAAGHGGLDHPLVAKSEDLPMVRVPQRRLDDLFRILVANAVEYRHPDRIPAIGVTVERQGAFWLFRVTDNGIGIDQTFFERIFIALERLHHRAEGAGTGIGLALARKIVESATGRIWVDSDGSSGSTFHFTLPAAGI